MSLTVERSPVTVTELVAAIRAQRHGTAPAPVAADTGLPGEDINRDSACRVGVVVLGTHPGAGASTVALALADATARRDADGHTAGDPVVRLVDTAPHEVSGLVCAAERELGRNSGGWQVGRRGAVAIYSATARLASPVDLPERTPSDTSSLVVDAGWSLPKFEAAPANAITALLPRSALVLVCRATVPGVRRAERVLADLATRVGPYRPVVVGVGARRWPGAARATFGPHLSDAHENGRVFLVPADRRLEVHGIDADPLPKAVTAAAGRLLDLVWPPPATTAHSPKG